MASGYLTLSDTNVSAVSTWTGNPDSSGTIIYTTPVAQAATVTVTVPSTMTGATFNSAILSYTVSSASGTRKVCYTGGAVSVTSANLLEKLQAGESISIYFQFKATGNSGGAGAHTATCMWKDISILVDYTPAANMTRTFTLPGAGTFTLAVDTDSLCYGEGASLTMAVTASAAISSVALSIRPSGLSATTSFTDTVSLASGSSTSRTHTLSITSEMNTAMTSRVYNAQFLLIATLTDGSTVSTGWAGFYNSSSKYLTLLTSRTAPAISAVTWAESGTSHIATYGNYIVSRSVPKLTFTVTLDTSADADISVASRALTVDGVNYTPGVNADIVLNPITNSGSIAYTITVTDSYGNTGTASGTVTVLDYTPCALTGLAIARYVTGTDSTGATTYELDDDGDTLWFDGTITCQTTLGSGSNPWTLIITPDGDSAITVASNMTSSPYAYVNNKSVLTDTYANTDEFGFTVTLSDNFTTVTQYVTVPKAGGIFNIETTGVAVGKRVTEGTSSVPTFECDYYAYFNEGMIVKGGIIYEDADGVQSILTQDTGWIALTLTNCTQASGWAECAYRLKAGIVYVRGAVTLSSSMSSSSTTSRTLTTLPMTARPAANMLVNAGARANTTNIEIDSDGTVSLWNRMGAAIGTSEVISITATFPRG